MGICIYPRLTNRLSTDLHTRSEA